MSGDALQSDAVDRKVGVEAGDVTDHVLDDLEVRNIARAVAEGGKFDAQWRLGQLVGALIAKR